MAMRQLSPALLKKAEKELNENPRRIKSDITVIRDWLRKQPHLESVHPTDQWLIAFLRGSKFSIERCKEKLEMYYTYKTIVPELLQNRDPYEPSIQRILKLGVFLPLRNCQKEDSPRVYLTRLSALGGSKYQLADLIKVAFMIAEILILEDDNFIVAGEDIIVDLKDVGVNVLSQWTPALAKKTVSCFEKALPVRVKSTHIFNTPLGFQTAYMIFKSLLKPKLRKRIKVHKDINNLCKAVPKSILPIEYGGTDGTLQELIDYWKSKVESYRYWFLEQEKARSDESKRSGGIVKNSAMVFGIVGSFRKLEFD